MSRNKIKTHEAIFQPLIEVVKNSDSVSDIDKKRYIKLTEKGKSCLTKAKIIEEYRVSPRVITAAIFFEDHYFLIISGLESVNGFYLLPLIEEDNPLYAALLEIALCDLKIPLIKNPQALTIINEIIPLYMGIENYEGHDIDTIKQFFLPIELYEIESTHPLQASQLIRWVGLRLCKQPGHLALPFSMDTLDLFEQVFLEGSTAIPYDNLVQCCYSVSWKHAFLEVYKCIERLYPIPLLDILHSKMGLGNRFSLLDLGKELEEILSWRPLEESSIEKIIEGSPTGTKDLLKEVKNSASQTVDMKISSWFYHHIRNSIVHFRAATQHIEMSDENWDKLIRATIQIIEDWYKRYENKLI